MSAEYGFTPRAHTRRWMAAVRDQPGHIELQ
jgi:hypothetical protein